MTDSAPQEKKGRWWIAPLGYERVERIEPTEDELTTLIDARIEQYLRSRLLGR